ncbi:hypothetical protein VM1G_11369 [Cytospora mali]|uniref:Uncharacterized protein n=1 Tax=Cytospora mali TaxID=578113 RepID=A0A194VRI6_CYTMA|nr:hypothetical protein VM1G_11369 [Valsa mali]
MSNLRKVDLPSRIEESTLQHYWDMCCLENVPLSSLPASQGALTDIPELPGKSLNSGASQGDSQGDPSKRAFPPASHIQVSDNPAADTPTPSGIEALRLKSFLASASTAYPPSPPSSEPASEEHKLWRFGHKVIKDPARARELWRQGHNLIPIESDTEGSDEKRGRSLPSDESAKNKASQNHLCDQPPSN